MTSFGLNQREGHLLADFDVFFRVSNVNKGLRDQVSYRPLETEFIGENDVIRVQSGARVSRWLATTSLAMESQ